MNLKEITTDKSFDYKYLYRRILPYARPYVFRIILGLVIAIPVGLLDAVVAFSLKPYMDYVIVKKNAILAALIPISVILFAIIQGVLKYLNNYLNDWSGKKITNDIRKDLFKKLLSLEPSFYDMNSSGIIINRFSDDAKTASQGLIDNIKEVISTICASISLIGVLIYNSWQLAFIAVFVLGSSMLPMHLIRKKVKFVSHESMKVGSEVLTHFNETSSGNKIINSYNLQDYQYKKFDKKINEDFSLAMKLTKSVGWTSPLMYFIASCGIAIVMWYGNHLIINNQISSGSFLSFVTSLLLLYKPIKTLGRTLASMQTNFVAMNRIFNILDIEPKIQNSENAVELNGIKNSISFENVWFEYEPGVPVLKNANFEVKAGELIALVGNSGGGKTTIANLIPRFYDITQGSIKIDGIDIKNIDLTSLRNNISIVFQDNFLFSGTIKENILLGKFDATDEEINKILKDVYLDELINSLPDGINTEIGERGIRLSGGQKQRIAIARALIKDAPIVILDEATSALDNKSEAIVQKALDKLMENKTVLVIAHRLSTIRNANRIIVVNEGEIVENGTHEELINIENGVYRRLYNMQFKATEPILTIQN